MSSGGHLNPILLHQNGQHISIDDEVLLALGTDLIGNQLLATGSALHGYEVVRQPRSLLITDDRARIPNAGCLPILHLLAEQRGIDLRVRTGPRISELPATVQTNYLWHPQLAYFVREHERGLIRYPRGVSPELLIADLAFAYPQQRIVVLGSHARQLDRMTKVLSSLGVNVQSIRAGKPLSVEDDADLPQVICSTPIEAATAELAMADIVLVLDAYQVGQERFQLSLVEIDARFRLLGLAKVGRKAAPAEEDAAMAVFGAEELELHRAGLTRRAAHVAWVSHCVPSVELEPNDPLFFPQCYWQNERRNRLIKQLGEALARGDELPGNRFKELARWFTDSEHHQSRSVTILVDRLPHAVALAKKLPDWSLVVPDAGLDSCPGSFRNRVQRQRREWITGQRQIVLADATKTFRGETSDVVIWAGGGKYVDAIPRSWLFTAWDSCRPLLILDFDDVFNATARAWSQQRKQHYYDRGIFPPGISPTQGRIAQFLVDHQARV